jgi:hypothetical protein
MCRRLCPPPRNNQPFLPDNCGKSNRRTCNGNSKSNRYDGSNRMCRRLKPPSLSNLPHKCGNSNRRICNGSSKSKRCGANSNSSRMCNANKTCDGNRMCRRLKPPSLSNLPHNCGNSNRRIYKGSSKNKRYGANSNSSRMCNANKTCDGSNRIRLLLRLLPNGQTFLREDDKLNRRRRLPLYASRRQNSVRTAGNNSGRRAKTTRSRTSEAVRRAGHNLASQSSSRGFSADGSFNCGWERCPPDVPT